MPKFKIISKSITDPEDPGPGMNGLNIDYEERRIR